jgi:predicted nucleic acid-binding Zn ribbon protein
MKPLGGAIDRLLRTVGLTDELAEAEAVRHWSEAAAAVLGADASLTRAAAVERHTLIVTVPDSQWGAEIRLRERELLRALEALAPRSGIRSIRAVPARSSGIRETSR